MHVCQICWFKLAHTSHRVGYGRIRLYLKLRVLCLFALGSGRSVRTPWILLKLTVKVVYAANFTETHGVGSIRLDFGDTCSSLRVMQARENHLCI